MRAVFDTNIIIDYLNGTRAADHEINLYKFKAISIITYIEVLVGIKDVKIKEKIKKFLETFEIIAIDQNIANQAIPLRQKHKIKLPDALILATAENLNALLISRDSKAFGKEIPILRIPYKIK